MVAGSGRFCVILVEDEAHQRDLLAEALRAEGYAVVAASSGAECLRAMREVRVDAVISDHHLPDIPGADLVRLADAVPEEAFVLLTGDREVSARRATVLLKPCDLETLLAVAWNAAVQGRAYRLMIERASG